MFKALRKRAIVVNRKRVRRLMRRYALAGGFISKRVRTTLTGEDAYPTPPDPQLATNPRPAMQSPHSALASGTCEASSELSPIQILASERIVWLIT